MRITNNIIRRNALSSLQDNLRHIERAQTQVTSGMRFQKASEDPAAASALMRSNGSLRALEQYRRNIQSAEARSAAEGTVLDQVTEALMRAKELGLQMGTANVPSSARRAAAGQAETILRTVADLGNAKFGDEFLFGGDTSAVRPFEVTGSGSAIAYTAPASSAARKVQVSDTLQVPSNADGAAVFETSGVLASLRDLTKALADDDEAGVRAVLTRLDDAFTAVQAAIGDQGARANQLTMTSANLDALEINLRTFKSDLSEIDMERAITDLVGRQTAYQAAMMAASKVIGMNLTDYLR